MISHHFLFLFLVVTRRPRSPGGHQGSYLITWKPYARASSCRAPPGAAVKKKHESRGFEVPISWAYTYTIDNIYTCKSISLHSGVITLHSGVRQLQLVLITMLFWTVGKQIWHRFCMLQHNAQSTLAVKHMFFSCFWCPEHALRCAPFSSARHHHFDNSGAHFDW